MSRHIISKEPNLGEFSDLVDDLRRELRSPGSLQPVILEETIGATRSRHVYVIWQKWSNIPDDIRSQVILQAYSQEETAESLEITIAIGVTPSEALALGLLPYKITCIAGPVSSEECRQAVQEESKNTILGDVSPNLRYPTLDTAEIAKRRLEERLPGSIWAIVQEIETST